VGALAYPLNNRFYIGEVMYRGEIHRGGLLAAKNLERTPPLL
jgi:hypothetical protein